MHHNTHDTGDIEVTNLPQKRSRQPKYKTEAERLAARRATKAKSRKNEGAIEKAREASKRHRETKKTRIAAAERANTVGKQSAASDSPGSNTMLQKSLPAETAQNGENSLDSSHFGEEPVGHAESVEEQTTPSFRLSTGALTVLRSLLGKSFNVTIEDELWDVLELSEESCRVVVERYLLAGDDPAQRAKATSKTKDRISARLCVLEGLRGMERYGEVQRRNQASATVRETVAKQWEAERQTLDAKLARHSLSLEIFSQHHVNDESRSRNWIAYQFIKVIHEITRQRSGGLSFEIDILRNNGAKGYMKMYSSGYLPWQKVSDNEGETVQFTVESE